MTSALRLAAILDGPKLGHYYFQPSPTWPRMVSYILICLKFRALIKCTKHVKIPTNEVWFMDVILLNSGHRCFGHSCDHLQGGTNKNTNTTEVCLKHSSVEKSCNLEQRQKLSEEYTASVLSLEGSSILDRELESVTQNNTQCRHCPRHQTPCLLLKTVTKLYWRNIIRAVK